MSNEKHFAEVLASTAPKICVVAGPGSGKTKGIIIPKARNLIEAGVQASEILLLSFSRLSALDLRERVKKLDKVPRASTVHSFALSYLLEENDHAIRDRIDSIALEFELEFLVADLKLLFQDVRKTDLEKTLQRFAAGWAVNPHDEVFVANDFELRFKAAVINWLTEHKAVMMGEIVYFAVDHILKSGKPPSLDGIEYIFVDEYQDLNRLEQEFLGRIGDGAKLFLAAGDPDQSIYSFKFAWRDGITQFYESSEVEGFTLPYCGRCATEILRVANQLLVQETPERTELPLSMAGKESGEIRFPTPFRTQIDEFRFVFDSIRDQLHDGVKPPDILILVPKYKLGKDFVEYAGSRAADLPDGVEIKFSNPPKFSPSQRERILILSLIDNPNSILHSRSYIGLFDAAGYASELAQIKKKYGDWKTLLEAAKSDDFPSNHTRVRGTCQRIEALRTIRDEYAEKTSGELIDCLFPAEDPEFSDLHAVLKSLHSENDTVGDLFSKFLDYSRTIPVGDRAVRLMTIMTSKGLEASHVYVIGCNAGNIPGNKRNDHLDELGHIQEQRRLLYVGFTRAQTNLTVTWAQHIPYAQSFGHMTTGVSTLKIDGELVTRVSICPFLQDLKI